MSRHQRMACQGTATGTGDHPLGPIWESSGKHESRRIRRHALGWLLVMGTLLGLAVYVQPDVRGVGTHTQLGLQRCSFLLTHRLPCPTCGMTTAFSLAVRGRWLAAAHAQPAGFVFALACGLLLVRGVLGLATGRTLRINWYRLRPAWVLVAGVALLLAAWGYKILAMRAAIG